MRVEMGRDLVTQFQHDHVNQIPRGASNRLRADDPGEELAMLDDHLNHDESLIAMR